MVTSCEEVAFSNGGGDEFFESFPTNVAAELPLWIQLSKVI
jgi:hypothetical protein